MDNTEEVDSVTGKDKPMAQSTDEGVSSSRQSPDSETGQAGIRVPQEQALTSDSAYLTSNTIEESSSSSSPSSPKRPQGSYGRVRISTSNHVEEEDDISDIIEDNGDISDGLDSDGGDTARPRVQSLRPNYVQSKSSCSYSSSQRTGVKPLNPPTALLGRLPSPTPWEKEGKRKVREARESARLKYPQAAKAVRVSTVKLSARSRESSDFSSSRYIESPRTPRKVLTWEEAMTARPPLKIDMEGPTPWSYTPKNKPLSESNSPQWSFGTRCFVEKPGGSRTSWEKSWFHTSDVWRQKTDFFSDKKWPPPNIYRQRATLGTRQPTLVGSPSFSIGVRRSFAIEKHRADEEPGPNEYNTHQADDVTLRRSPSYTQGSRVGGTVLWQSVGCTPGPGAYDPTIKPVHTHRPAFSIRGIRREKSHVLGPFATF